MAPRNGVDSALIRDLTGLITDRLVGRSVKLGPEDSQIRGTVAAASVRPADYTISAQVEAGLDVWGDVNDAALSALERPDPLRAGMKMFEAMARGVDKMLGASPVDPVVGRVNIFEQLDVSLAEPTHRSWTARELRLVVDDVTLMMDTSSTSVRAPRAALRFVLSEADIANAARALGLDERSSIVIDDQSAHVNYRVGPATGKFPLELSVERDDVIVRVSEICVGSRRVKLPRRFRRHWSIPRVGRLGIFTIDSAELDESGLVVAASADDVVEPVTATQLRGLLRTMEEPGAVRVDRVSAGS